jgi:3-hydroxyisobutyrate dehydrogenase-like beta-hydroxyacid dehydrogenase
MNIETVAILSPGEMGAAVGKAFADSGFNVITTLEGRSESTQDRATASGFQDGGSLFDVIAAADIVLSILPPASATAQAEAVASAMRETGKTPPYVDCNAVAPETTIRIGQIIANTGADYIDGGIIGNPPGKSKPTRFYVSGPGAIAMSVFDGKGIVIHQCGPEIGRGSAVKMAYAGITKGTSALHAAMLIAAERLGVGNELFGELQSSQAALYKRMENMTSALPAVSGRYIGEMLEIANTMAACDMPPGFHEGAADLYRLLEKSPFSSERRDTVDKNRTLRQTIEVCAKAGTDKAIAE